MKKLKRIVIEIMAEWLLFEIRRNLFFSFFRIQLTEIGHRGFQFSVVSIIF